ncbi:MAG: undecaprenyldiphospho-muramoylpentapeptide beta-N-acetylglucosaminyltransferase [Saprospiraceae bacterium]|nr:undecaprenyldiphospho-muramoylpentapeptide beta-N-acetylglucosaminyltransferase [Saprospiraceae bacterium]
MNIIISAGGTGGHIFPAVAVADELKRRDPSVNILFVGAEGKMEMERVPKAGYAIEGLWIAGLQRRLTLRNLWLNLQLPIKLVSSMLKVRRILNDFKPDIAVGFGGFASGPTLRAAANKNIPTILQEQNSYAGVTNKLLAQKAAKICVAYEGLDKFFPADKLVLTGNPVRSDILAIKAKRTEGVNYFGLDPHKKTIAILGGSLGAKTLNVAMETSAALIKDQSNVQILWQCGRLYEEDFKNGQAAQLPNVQMRPFIDRMDLAYAVADVIVARAGALTISELCLAGTPSVLVPSPNVAEDHQTKNAMALVNKKAALLVRDVEASEKMIPTALELIANTSLSADLSQNILSLGKPNAAKDIADVILATIQKRT